MAQTEGIIEGHLLAIYIAGVAVGYQTGGELSVNRDMRDTTNKDSASNNKQFAPADGSWSISGDHLVAFDAAKGFSELNTAKENRTLVTVKFSNENTGDDRWSGSGYITSLRMGAGDGDNLTASFTVQGTGALAEETIT